MQQWTNPDLPLVAFDAGGSQIDATFDGEKVQQYDSPLTLLADLATPHRIVAERSLEAYKLSNLDEFLAQVEAAGHEARWFNQRQTRREGRRLGEAGESRFLTTQKVKDRKTDEVKEVVVYDKSDRNDARVIYRIGTNGRTHLARMRSRLPLLDPWRDQHRLAKQDLMWLRRGDWSVTQAELAKAVKRQLLDQVPMAKEDQARIKGFTMTMVATVYVVALHTETRDEFERMLGNYGTGHPSQFRSNYYFWNYEKYRDQRDLSTMRRDWRWLRSLLIRELGVGPGRQAPFYGPYASRPTPTG